MNTTTKKLILGLISILGGWGVGAIVFFVLSAVKEFSKKAQPIPYIFAGVMLVLMIVYLIYWSISKTSTESKEKVNNLVFMIIGCVVAIASYFVAGLIIGSAVQGLVSTAALCEAILLVVGNVLAFILGRVRIGG